MIIGHRTIKVTDAEFDTIGIGVETFAYEEIKLFEDFEAYRLIHKDTIDLLHGLINLGYPLYLRDQRYHDAWDWAEAKHIEVWKTKN